MGREVLGPKELRPDQASPFIRAVFDHPAIYLGQDNSPVLTVDPEGMEELSAWVLCPGVEGGGDGYCRINVKYRHRNHPNPREFEDADYFAAELVVPHAEIPGLDGFFQETSDGWDEFLKRAGKRDRQLPEPGIHRSSKNLIDSGTVYLKGWDESGFILQMEDLWTTPYDAIKAGLSIDSYGNRTVEVIRQLARTVPAYLFEIQNSNRIEKWQDEREKRRKSKPAPWTLALLQKTGVDVSGEWLMPEDSAEPDTYLASGWLDKKKGWFVIVKSEHFEHIRENFYFGTDDLEVCFLLPGAVQKMSVNIKAAEKLTVSYRRYLEDHLRKPNGNISVTGPDGELMLLLPTVICLDRDAYHPGLVLEGFFHYWKNPAERDQREKSFEALLQTVKNHDQEISGFVASLRTRQ